MKLGLDPRLTDGPGFFAALVSWAREVIRAVNGSDDTAATQAAQIAALQAALAIVGVTGEFKWFALGAAPAGWVAGNGATIGSAASGATRANADTLALFTAWWASFTDAQLPILTSAGGASTRGASAAADWAANKRLTVFDVRDRFIRAGGLSYAIGTKYAGSAVFNNGGNAGAMIVPYTVSGVENGDGAGPGQVTNYGIVAPTSLGPSAINNTLVRPVNIAMLGCFKL